MDLKFFIPVLAVVASNMVYHNAAKHTPNNANAFLSLAVTYFVSTIISIALYLIFAKGASLSEELHKLNWASYLLGAAVVGIEIGFIYMYRVGWEVSKGSLVCGAAGAIILFFIGCAFYHEPVTLKKIAGILVCVVGLLLING